MRRLIGKFILWALGSKGIFFNLTTEPGDFILVVKPWWQSHEEAQAVAHKLSEITGRQVATVPDGTTLAVLKSAKRVEKAA